MPILNNHEVYKEAKGTLIWFSSFLGFEDKPLRRMRINNSVDALVKGFPPSLSDKKKELYSGWLSNLACRLHEKDL